MGVEPFVIFVYLFPPAKCSHKYTFKLGLNGNSTFLEFFVVFFFGVPNKIQPIKCSYCLVVLRNR